MRIRKCLNTAKKVEVVCGIQSARIATRTTLPFLSRFAVDSTSGIHEMMMKTVKHDDWLLKKLQDAEFAAEFLYAASEDDDPKTYLTALRQEAALGGFNLGVTETDV